MALSAYALCNAVKPVYNVFYAWHCCHYTPIHAKKAFDKVVLTFIEVEAMHRTTCNSGSYGVYLQMCFYNQPVNRVAQGVFSNENAMI